MVATPRWNYNRDIPPNLYREDKKLDTERRDETRQKSMNKWSIILRRNLTTTPTKQLRPFNELFPSKRFINKILFEIDSDKTYHELLPKFTKLYQNTSYSLRPLYDFQDSHELMLMNKILRQISKRQRMTNESFIKMENLLLERAAELGDNDAISMLCFNILKDNASGENDGDVKNAKKLVKELLEIEHPLTLKNVGDLCVVRHDNNEAKRYYNKFLQTVLHGNDDNNSNVLLIGQVYEKLGEIEYQEGNFLKAEEYWLKCIKICKLEDCNKSYFYLGKIYLNSEPLKSKVLFENCATQGFKEAFKELGFLEMNYFKNYDKAIEWFKLGMELFDIQCFFGFFQSCYHLKKWGACSNCLKSLKRFESVNKSYKDLIDQFLIQTK
ncbi:Mss2p NDAI_0B03300 [Naumovozyma dairenensis CBS 421]|uniref:Uncharacterized protein n=1 Tax=Naumovozyma dairenensis (strain ATCC 10597 / BCRC 20456 / CBS 421 / NBRC 0211 / NRRL Y-12639) TaxID=1071378 RepID=G0W6F3_NAUDC|nr:hypothetical protein NDAI_0B03300 [Naumovozyma dairenensis CBS 421]CCD23364.1 hypothetical protein NDAI_0B03300 [Naumovozyma dairenensis CBS 421]